MGEPPLRLSTALAAKNIDANTFSIGHIGQSWEVR
jgi:hypothetical protein